MEIENFIGYEISYKNAKEISLKFNKKKIRKLIKNNDENLIYKIQNKKDIELNLDSRLSDTRRLLEMKQREMDQMAQKLSLPVDTDILRMKIQKDIESRHRIDMDTKIQENERLSDQFYESKRQLDILKTQHELMKFEHEKDINDTKERFRSEI